VPLLTSLLTAIARADGDALVLHSGERPYVVAPAGQSQLSSRALTLDAMTGMLRELLPEESRRVLDEVGAVQHDLADPTIADGERFTVVAARGGDDIWIEIRRHRRPAPVVDPAPDPLIDLPIEPVPEEPSVPAVELAAESTFHQGDQLMAEVAEPPSEWTPGPANARASELSSEWAPEPSDTWTAEAPSAGTPEPVNAWADEPPISAPPPQPEPEPAAHTAHVAQDEWTASTFELVEEQPMEMLEVDENVHEMNLADPGGTDEHPAVSAAWSDEHVGEPPQQDEVELPQAEPLAWNPPTVAAEAPSAMPREVERESMSAVVVPLARSGPRDLVREKPTIRFVHPQHTSGIDRLLRAAAARGASTLYLTSQARPSIRVNGEITPMDGEPVLSESEVEALMLEIVPESHRDALRGESGTEWVCDVPDVGRLRCVTFRDHRGAGGIFRMIPARAISAEQLGLSPDIQALCDETNGLVLVAGPRSSGKSTLIAAFVDLINRTRSDHVVTLEHQITFVHENRGSLVSQREVRGANSEWLSAARAALRENPDVLVIEDLRSPEIVTLAIEAADSGRLVIGAITAHTASAAVEALLHHTPADRRPSIQVALADVLRGVVAQVLLRKTGGGRIAARELLLNTPGVASLIAEGKTTQLPGAIESGRRHGMVALNEALVAFVQSGVIDSREAYRQAADQQGFLALLQRQGIDTSFVERLA
jgi:twitching motility protein PilT